MPLRLNKMKGSAAVSISTAAISSFVAPSFTSNPASNWATNWATKWTTKRAHAHFATKFATNFGAYGAEAYGVNG